MSTGLIKSMLLLEEPNITGLRLGIESYSKIFLSVAFIAALTWQFLTDMKFLEVVKNLVLALVFMGCFYEFHTQAVDLSFTASEQLLREVSPRNIFLRKWSEVKVKTSENSKSSFISNFAIPNLNDLLGTALFLMSKVCILILKLIYTTVYYFTFIFAPVTAVLSLLPGLKNSMSGSITSSLWCILLPFVLVVFLALVGNSVQIPAANGQLAITSMDQLIWIFGITLLMLLTPSFTFSLIKGSVASTADAIGVKMTGVGAKALVGLPIMYGLGKKVFGIGGKVKGGTKASNEKNNGLKFPQSFQPYSRKFSSNGGMSNLNSKGESQAPLQGKGGLNSELVNQSSVKLSEMKTHPQTANQMPKVSSGFKAPGVENTKSNIINSKIPSSSSSESGNSKQEQNRNYGSPKINPYSNFVQRNFKPVPHSPQKILNTNVKNVVSDFKITQTKPSFSQLKPKEFKTVKPKEHQREV